jgi:predicted component of type VI protein secretion system
MVQFQILSGKQAGTRWVARRFPARIGRSTVNDLQLEENGVWDEHLELTLDLAQGFLLTSRSNALVTVNHVAAQTARLRNGDSIEIGSVRMRFWLGETGQRGLRVREGLVWSVVAFVSLGQVVLVYWLLR